MKKPKVVTKKIDDLKLAGYNPRQISEGAMRGLKSSLEEFGYIDLIVVNKDGTIIGGHQRYEALKEQGVEEIEVVEVDFDKMTEKRANVALNNPNIQGEFVEDLLAELVEEIAVEDDEVLIGLISDEVEKIVEKVEPEIEFSAELNESYNYVVLLFDNDIDWNAAKETLNLKTVKTHDTTNKYKRMGIGKVVNGTKIIERLNKRK